MSGSQHLTKQDTMFTAGTQPGRPPISSAAATDFAADRIPPDAMGVRHKRALNPRIVSLVPSLTELLFDLDLGPSVVGRTAYCVHPAAAVRKIPAVGGTKRANLRKLLARTPTHVVVNVDENPKELADALIAAGITVVATHPITVDDNLHLYHLFGAVFDREAEARALETRFFEHRSTLTERVRSLQERRVLYLIWKRPWMTVSTDTYISQILAEIRWRTACHEPKIRYPEVAIDARVLADIDYVLLATEPFPFRASHAKAFVEEFATSAGKVHLIDGEFTAWYGSRAIAAFDYLGDFASAVASGTRAPAA